MGTFVFEWEHPASEVIVTGTFDNWAQTEKLHKKGDIFEKEVTLPSAAEKIYYKFLVDGNWVIDHTAPQEKDSLGNLNNYLTTDRIKTHTHTPAATAIMSGVAPNSTTAALAKDVPKENGSSTALPGAFPETPATEPESFSVNPIPASAGNGNPITLAPGEAVPHPSTINANTIASGVHDDEELKAADLAKEPTYSVNPIPATAGGGNPITLAPGEPVPHPSTITGNTIASTIRTDKESYEKSGGLGTAPFQPPVVTHEAERDAKGTGVLDLPSTSKGGLIPESSLAMGEGGAGNYDACPTIQSVGPGATTAALAGAVPLEKNIKGKDTATIQSVGPSATTAALAGTVPLETKESSVPDVVKESQEAANFPPEASAVPEEVEEKKEVERELLSGVPLAPVTSDDTTKEAHDAKFGAAGAAAAVGAAVVAVGGAAFAVGSAAKDKVSEVVANGPSPSQVSKSTPIADSIRESISSINETAKRQSVAGIPAASDAVPAPVRESISAAHESPEAAAYQVPVKEKKEVEGELLREVPTDMSKGESAPSSAAGGAVATAAPAIAAPAVVAAAREEVVVREASLPKESVVSDLSGISPGTIQPVEKQTSPVVTTGVASGVVPATSIGAAPATPAKDSTAGVAATKAAAAASPRESPSGSPSAALAKEAQQKKRRSFFGKLKDKLKDL
ncbi:hypothetical protein VC83_06219 [Pseudogymnoascus destructans]|uniref:AMP-activated protein kinase glycogen-binding domain-containing protein n=2 Tax=Pseudogymnoascus destructans TaxID=655981 RepID=L8GCB3_PSED2|nr:uncharacterized protein VC83_06219 [Pseudogymnoascus destructans]ELR09671.1 hypothetical protein GMDG_04157 [Pseudogymnoascus destructans 20631-21]OAF58960.1 hypothetical protein VC83_06219 [Pseudogymnoascus destructans]